MATTIVAKCQNKKTDCPEPAVAGKKQCPVRGLLCSHCNHGLGSFQDSIQILESAAEYLRRRAE